MTEQVVETNAMKINHDDDSVRKIFRRALKVNTGEKSVLRELTFSDCIVQNATPGYWTTAISTDSFDYEAVARMLSKGDLYQRFTEICLSDTQITTLIKNLFPVKLIHEGSMTLTFDEVNNVVAKTLGDSVSSDAAYVTTLVLVEMLSPLRIVNSNVGHSMVEYRSVLFPTEADLKTDILTSELISILQTSQMSVSVASKKFTPAVLAQNVRQMFYNLGSALRLIEEGANILKSALIALKKFILNNHLEEDDRLSVDVMKVSTLSEMASNLTLVKMAFEYPVTSEISIADWQMGQKIEMAYRYVKSSKRFSVTSLSEATSSMGHVNLTGYNNKVWGAVAYNLVATSSKSQIGWFDSRDAETQHSYKFVPIKLFQDSTDSLTSKALPDSHMKDLVDSVVSLFNFERDSDDEILCMGIGLSELDMFHYAVALGRSVQLTQSDEEYGFAFRVDVSAVHLKLEDPELMSEHISVDPFAYILAQDDNETVSPKKLDHQAIPDNHLDKNLLVDPKSKILDGEAWTREYEKEFNTSINIGPNTLKANISIIELLSLPKYEDVRAIVQPCATTMFRYSFSTYREMYDYFKLGTLTGGDKTVPAEVRTLRVQLAAKVASIFERVSLTDAGVRLGRRVIDILREGNVDKDTKLALRKFKRDGSLRAQVQFYAAGLVLVNSGLISYSDYAWAKGILVEAEFFERMKNDSRYELPGQ